VAEIVEIVEHEIHIFLLLALQVMDNSLILVHLDPDVRVGLPRYGSRLDETSRLLVHVVASLRGGDVMSNVCVEALLSSAHGLVVEFAALLLELIITDVKCVSAKAVVAHPHLILLTIQMIEHLVIVLVVIVDAGVVYLLQVGTVWFHHVQAVVSLVVTVPVGSIVLVSIYLILRRLPTSTIVIEHRILRSPRIIADLHLSAVLESQVLLSLPIVLRV